MKKNEVSETLMEHCQRYQYMYCKNSQRTGKRHGAEKILEEIMATNSPN
jgi:hypothetical protein